MITERWTSIALRAVLAATLVLASGSQLAIAAADLSKTVDFNIAPQPLPAALLKYSEQSGVQVASPSLLLDGRTSAGVVGKYAAGAALERVLDGTGLEYAVIDAGAVVIHLAGAAANVDGARASSDDVASAQTNRGLASRLARATSQNALGSAPDDEAGSQAKSTDVGEIVVTATKREQRVRDVPVSMAVLTADDIDRRGLTSAADYLRGIPGVNQVDTAEGQSIVIRGMETSPYYQNFSSGPTTATYFGETPTTSVGGLGTSTNIDIKLIDIERVEVLRGPQGTAFGNSSIGGAVRIIPVAPKLDRFAARLTGGYSATSDNGGDSHYVQVIGNIPLVTDKLAIRAAAYQYRDSGFYRNVAGTDAGFQASAALPYGAQAFAGNEEEVGSSNVLGGRIAALLQVSEDFRLTVRYLSQKSETDGFPIATSGAFEQTLFGVAREHSVRGQGDGVSDMDVDIANATLEYDLAWADILVTYSRTKSGSIVSAPYQLAGRYWPASYISDSEHNEDVGEIRLATRLEGALNFLVGVYAEDLEDEVLFDYRWFGNPALNVACGACAGLSNIGDQLQLWDLKQKAAFGEVSWTFLPGLTFTGGLRAYDYERTIRVNSPGNFFFGPAAPGTIQTASEASGTTLRGNLSYKPGENVLVYAGWSQGFRLGKPQPALPAGVCDLDGNGIVDGTNITLSSTGSVESDDVDNFELGAKFAALDRRLTIDAAVFRMEWSGLPVRVGTPAPCNRAYNTNAGAAVSEGVELQANFQIAEPLRVDLGGSWIDARLAEDVPLQGFAAGDRLPGSPEINANFGVQYEFGIGNYKAFVRADSIYVGSFYGDIPESPNTRSGGYVKLDASLRVQIRNLNIDLFARNLTNEDAFTFRGILPASAARPMLGEFYGYRLRPRTIGLQLGYSF